MNYIVIDFEFNQSYDFTSNTKGKVNQNCTFEIIQIGAYKLNNSFEVIDSFNQLVKPNIYKKLHPHVSKITGLTNESLSDAKHFTEVYKEFNDFLGDDEYVFCTWGKIDIKILFRNLIFYNIDICPVSKKYIDVQSIISKKITKSTKALVGLENACKHFEITDDTKQFHDAYNDAFYTAMLTIKAKPGKKSILSFRANDLLRKSNKRGKINTAKIYKIAENSLNRELTEKEKEVVLTIYNLGRNRQCDL